MVAGISGDGGGVLEVVSLLYSASEKLCQNPRFRYRCQRKQDYPRIILHSVSPISLSTTYLNLDMLVYSICPVPLSLLGDRLFVRFWGDISINFN